MDPVNPIIRFGLKDSSGLRVKSYTDLAEAKREAMGLIRSRAGEHRIEVVAILAGGPKPVCAIVRNRKRPHALHWKEVPSIT
jgi:hypothetical protein